MGIMEKKMETTIMGHIGIILGYIFLGLCACIGVSLCTVVDGHVSLKGLGVGEREFRVYAWAAGFSI